MSGASLAFAYRRIADLAAEIESYNPEQRGEEEGEREEREYSPEFSRFADHLRRVAHVAKEIEWAWSFDSSVEDAETAVRSLLDGKPPTGRTPDPDDPH